MMWINRVFEWVRRGDHARASALSLALFAAAFALYARTMAPGLLDGDEGEFQINIYRLGVSHTGYPLFFLLGKLFTLLVPIGTMATRANLYVVFWSALAVVSIFGFIRFLTKNTGVAFLGALVFAASRVEWSQAIIPRPYTLNSLFVVLITLFFFLWRIGKIDLTIPVFITGLSLTNHRTMIWFAPAIALFVLIGDFQMTFAATKPSGNLFSILVQWVNTSPFWKPRRILTLFAALLAPLLLYGYVFWRGDSDVGVEFHMKDFNDMILAGNANRWMRYGPLDWLISRITDLYLPLLIEQFTPVGFSAGLIGLLALALNRAPRGWPVKLPARQALLFIVLANIGNSLFCVFFWTMDVEKFFLPSYITFFFLASVGVAALWDWLAARARFAPAALGALLLATSGYLVWNNFSVNDFSRRTDVISTWQENLALPLEQNALIVGNWETLTPLEYARYVHGQRADLERWKVIIKQDQLSLTLYGSRQQDIEREVRAGRPVYLTFHPSETETLGILADEFRLVKVGNLWRVINLPPQAKWADNQAVTAFGDRSGNAIELLGYTLYPSSTLRAGGFGLLTQFWRAPQTSSARLTISFRLIDSQSNVVFQRDAEPANGARPTLGWAPNEIVQDDIGFFVPLDAAPGIYKLALVVYNPANGEELRFGNGSIFGLGDLNIVP